MRLGGVYEREGEALLVVEKGGDSAAPEADAAPGPDGLKYGETKFEGEPTTAVEKTDSGALPGLQLIFQRAAGLLRNDEHSITRRSNKDSKMAPNTPLFPLSVDSTYWASVLGSGHPLADGTVLSGVCCGLNHLAGFVSADVRLDSSSSSKATTPPSTTSQAQVEKRLAAVAGRHRCWFETDTEVCFDSFS